MEAISRDPLMPVGTHWLKCVGDLPDDALDAVVRDPRRPDAERLIAELEDD